MTPRPEPSPTPTVTVTVPVPVATPQVTMTVHQDPPDQPHSIEYIDGVGSMLAALAAAIGLIIALIQASKARSEATQQLQDERDAADRRLQAQLDAQRERDRRDFVIDQLQRVGDLYAEKIWASSGSRADYENKAMRQLEIHLPAIPGAYASLLKLYAGLELNEEATAEAQRRLGTGDLTALRGMINSALVGEELADNISELLAERADDLDGA
ncbi:hypothetical protein ACIBH1_05545 [Nonomuraea sp. NPDC050663]|uniref:hypothetical protein n=1 Tax=Nonomuraea sp. NPDC050663 TaxID=3364370 RepID=UPI00378F0127